MCAERKLDLSAHGSRVLLEVGDALETIIIDDEEYDEEEEDVHQIERHKKNVRQMEHLFTGDSWAKITTDADDGLAGQLAEQIESLLKEPGARIWARIHETGCCYATYGCLGVTLGGATLMTKFGSAPDRVWRQEKAYIVFKEHGWIAISYSPTPHRHIPHTIVPSLVYILSWARLLLQPNTTPPPIPRCGKFKRFTGASGREVMRPRSCIDWVQMIGTYQLVDGALLVPVTNGNRVFIVVSVSVWPPEEDRQDAFIATDGDQYWFAAPLRNHKTGPTFILLPRQLGGLKVPSEVGLTSVCTALSEVRISPFDVELLETAIATFNGGVFKET